MEYREFIVFGFVHEKVYSNEILKTIELSWKIQWSLFWYKIVISCQSHFLIFFNSAKAN